MTVGERIKQKRIELNMSQDELAHKVGYKSRSSIQKIESARKLPLDKIELMAIALECSISYLMDWNEETPEQQIREAYYKGGIRRTITDREVDLIILYRAASRDIQTAIDKILGLENAEKRDIG